MELNAVHLQEILAILSELDPEQVLEKIVHIVPPVFRSKACALFLRDEENEDEIVLIKSAPVLPTPPGLRITYQRGEGLTGWVFKHRQPLLLTDLDRKSNDDLRLIAHDLQWKGKYTGAGLQKPRSYLGVPLLNPEGRFLGVIRMSADDINFTPAEMELLVTLARYISVALEKVSIFAHERRKSEYFTLLTDIGTKLHTYYNRGELLRFIAEGCARTFSSETCEIYIRDTDDPGLLVLQAGYGIPAELVGQARHRVGEGLTGTIVQEGRILRSRNVLTLAQYKGKYRNAIKGTLKYGDRLTFLGVPIKVRADNIGCIKLYNKIPRDRVPYFTEDAERFLAILADMLAVALENLQYLESMQISAVKMMQIQRLTALGTLAIRVPNEISNPLTVARLNTLNLLRSLRRSARDGHPPDAADTQAKAETIRLFLDEVAAGIKTLQEFSTKAGFMKLRRPWPLIIDEGLLFLSNDLMSKKVRVARDKAEEARLPEVFIEPNEGIEILVTLLKCLLDSVRHYEAEISIATSLTPEPTAIVTTLLVRDNVGGTPVHPSAATAASEARQNLLHHPTHFALKVSEEIVRTNYGGEILTLGDDPRRPTGFRLTLPADPATPREMGDAELRPDH